MAIKMIVELQAKPGRRAELKSLLESMVEKHGPSQRGFLGSTRYEVLDNPNMLIEIADGESAEVQAAHMQESAATVVYAPLLQMLAAPFRATVIRQLPGRAAGVTVSNPRPASRSRPDEVVLKWMSADVSGAGLPFAPFLIQ